MRKKPYKADIGITVLRRGKAWYHRVDPFTGRVGWFSWFYRPGVPRRSVNATGEELHTQGRLLVLWLADVSSRD